MCADTLSAGESKLIQKKKTAADVCKSFTPVELWISPTEFNNAVLQTAAYSCV